MQAENNFIRKFGSCDLLGLWLSIHLYRCCLLGLFRHCIASEDQKDGFRDDLLSLVVFEFHVDPVRVEQPSQTVGSSPA